jgi:chemotaxis family two-component system sensor kinase Cph1
MSGLDITTCESEPIHIPGMIQPHGVLLVLRFTDLTIRQVSANAGQLLGIPEKNLLGQPIESIFPAESARKDYRSVLTNDLHEGKPVYLFTVHAGSNSAVFDAIAHRSGDHILFELELVFTLRELSVQDLYRLVQASIIALRGVNDVKSMCDVCARQIRRIAGFDRVMLYRFDPEWNGQVIAEEKRGDLEPFLGLRYPAADIPRQARELYTKNWLRFIPDRGYTPVGLISAGDESTVPLDMSFSVLRSVSPIHVQYLQNMGVGASMSVSIVKNRALWGLIACHHYSPRNVPYDVRTACELLAQVMSTHLAAAEDAELKAYAQRMKQTLDTLIGNLDQMEDYAKALLSGTPNLLDFIHAGGAAVVHGNEVMRVGQTPGEDQIRNLARQMHEKDFDETFATDSATPLFGQGLIGSVAAGVLVLKLGRSEVRQIIWFRPEQIRTVHWAGDPAKSVKKGDKPDRLSPRGSFALWKETLTGRSEHWTDAEVYTARLFREQLMTLLIRRAEQNAMINRDLRLASVEREKLLESERSARSEAEKLNHTKDEFIATLSHELRTPLNAILGWSQLLSREPNLSQDMAEAIEIIERNARSQSQMIEDLLEMSRIISGKLRLDLQETHLPSILRSAIETVRLTAEAKGVRLEYLIDPLHNVNITGDPNRLQQVIWNLLTNAVKFTPRDGKVQIVLQRVNSHVELSVADTGAGIKPEFLPYVFDRFRQADASASRKHGGLGLGLSIVRNIVELHGGSVRAQSQGLGYGATFVVSLPIRIIHVPADDTRVHPRSQRQVDCDALNLDGVRVLVVDDEADARTFIERLLIDCHCTASAVGSVSDALERLKSGGFDVLVSDIGMPGEDGYSLIKKLREFEESNGKSKIPAVALTAYARTEDRRRAMLAGFQAHVAKPVEAGELLAVIASLAGRV